MNLYLISQDAVRGYDIYDSAVVAAESENDARHINPSSFVTHHSNGKWMGTDSLGNEYENKASSWSWVQFSDIHLIKVKYLGIADSNVERGVICASFNAG